MKLISMTDYVLEQKDKVLNSELGIIAYNYAQFLKQPLELWMFVPCDENGNVLEEPKGEKCCGGAVDHCGCNGFLQYDEESIYCYQQAKERVLFEATSEFNIESIKYHISHGKTIESIVNPYDLLYLTQTAQNQLK